jgi:hypothetical protein
MLSGEEGRGRVGWSSVFILLDLHQSSILGIWYVPATGHHNIPPSAAPSDPPAIQRELLKATQHNETQAKQLAWVLTPVWTKPNSYLNDG